VIPPHEATTITPPDSGLVWDTTFAGAPGRVVGHIDVCPENTVFRDGRAVAFIDFHFAAPTDPVLDLAHLLRMWVPLGVAHDPSSSGAAHGSPPPDLTVDYFTRRRAELVDAAAAR
jgi:aminoglycoside phosphotransferase (APT) family kinase protein